MTPDEFRALALALPEATEAAHMGHPDFRVKGKIFATLGPARSGWGMVKLTPIQQQAFASAHPEAFAPIGGAWGRGGATRVLLRAATRRAVRAALVEAWRNTAPRGLVVEVDARRGKTA